MLALHEQFSFLSSSISKWGWVANWYASVIIKSNPQDASVGCQIMSDL